MNKDFPSAIYAYLTAVRPMLAVGALVMSVYLAVFLRDIVFANIFGAGGVLDLFFLAYLLPALVMATVVDAITPTLIPAYMRNLNQSRKAANDHFSSSFGLLIALLAGVSALTFLVFVGFTAVLRSFGGSVNQEMVTKLTLLILPAILFSGVVKLHSARLNAHRYFALPALVPIIPPTVAILCVLLFSDRLGIYAAGFGILFGAALEALVMVLLARDRRLFHPPTLLISRQNSRELGVTLYHLAAASSLLVLLPSIDQLFAATFESGTLSELVLGRKIPILLCGLISVPLSTVILPQFSMLVAKRRYHSLRLWFTAHSCIVMSMALIVCLIFPFVSEQVVELVYLRGQVLREDILGIGNFSTVYMYSLPFFLQTVIGLRLASSLGYTIWIPKLVLQAVLANIVLNYLFANFFGAVGLAWATVTVLAVTSTVLSLKLSVFLSNEHIQGQPQAVGID